MVVAQVILESTNGEQKFDVTLSVRPWGSFEVATCDAKVAVSGSHSIADKPLQSAIESACWSGVRYGTGLMNNRKLRIDVLSASGKCIAGAVEGFAIASSYAVVSALRKIELFPHEVLKDLQVRNVTITEEQ
jgi:hypothetical protein